MSTSGGEAEAPAECGDVYDLLGEIRLRLGLWVCGGSLRELETLLWGYDVALRVHGVGEPFPFASSRTFSDWLYARFGWGTALGWAHAIEENAGEAAPLDLFFRLVDEFRHDQQPGQGAAGGRARVSHGWPRCPSVVRTEGSRLRG